MELHLPHIGFALAVSVSLGLLIFIVPKFKSMFDGMGANFQHSRPSCSISQFRRKHLQLGRHF